MSFDVPVLMKSLSPKLAVRALQTFDRAMTIVVGLCWAAALMMMMFAIYTISLSVSARHASEDALASEPSLPQIVRTGVDTRYLQILVDRMQHRYPELGITLQSGNTISVIANDGNKFHQWLTSLSYIDTISPEYHWSIKDFCVGKCGGEVMRAILIGEKITFDAPKP